MVNYHLLGDSVVLSYKGKLFTISKSDNRFPLIIKAIKGNKLKDIPAIVDFKEKLKKAGLNYSDGVVTRKNETMPESLHKRIIDFQESGLPFDTLIRFWDNLRMNPSENSRKMLYQFLENNGHPLTSDGCFIAYRGVNSNFTDKHTGTFSNTPGSVCSMPRDQVDSDPNQTCSHGFHVACFEYAKGFGEKMVEVKVHPMDVVAVPTDYNGTKMRVCRFEVVRECDDGLKTEPVYKHDEKDAKIAASRRYLVKEKGQKLWAVFSANGYKDALDKFLNAASNKCTVYLVRHGNKVKTFDESTDVS